jgi:hypothetical protein
VTSSGIWLPGVWLLEKSTLRRLEGNCSCWDAETATLLPPSLWLMRWGIAQGMLPLLIAPCGCSSACIKPDVPIPNCCALHTGKYTKDNLPGGARALVINEERVNAVQPLLGLMRDIGSAHGGKTPGQVLPGSKILWEYFP